MLQGVPWLVCKQGQYRGLQEAVPCNVHSDRLGEYDDRAC